jgi:hypothetical protein
VTFLRRVMRWIHPHQESCAPRNTDAHARAIADAKRRQRETERRIALVEARTRGLKGNR